MEHLKLSVLELTQLSESMNVEHLSLSSTYSGFRMYGLFQSNGNLVFLYYKDDTKWLYYNIQIERPVESLCLCSNYDGSVIYSSRGSLGVYYTDNNGLNWWIIKNNLNKDEYITSIACNGTGDKLISCTNTGTDIYISTNEGETWKSVYNGKDIKKVASNSSSVKLYAIVGENIYTNVGGWGNKCVNDSIKLVWDNLCCNETGDKVFAVSKGTGIYLFYKDTPLFIKENISNLSSYMNGKKLLTVDDNNCINISDLLPPLMCIKENTKILCFNGFNEVYIPVEVIKKGDLIKIKDNGYKKVENVVYRAFFNLQSKDRIENIFYVYPKGKIPNLTDNLILTGSTNVLSESELENLPCYLDDRSYIFPYSNDFYAVYYISLESDDITASYGIWVNGMRIQSSPIYCLDLAHGFKYDPKSANRSIISC